MRFWWALVILLGPAAPAWAQTSSVAGGEHGDFTRLTFTLADPQWSLTPTDVGYDLTFGADTSFDLTRAYERIQKDRVADLRTDGAVLHIDLGCECRAEPFVWNGSHLVLDIKPGLDPARQAQVQAQVRADVAPIDLPILTSGSNATSLDQMTRASRQLDLALASAVEHEDKTGGLELDIARSIARAATQGLLEPSGGGLASEPVPSSPERPMENPVPERSAVPQPTHEAAAPSVENQPEIEEGIGAIQDNFSASIGITFQTSIDRDSPGLGSSEVPTQTEPGCLPESLFEMDTWIDDRSFADQIGEKRVTLTSELDRVPPDAAVALAKTYIGFGFGREAIQALKIDGTSSQERRVLSSIAATLDELPLPYPELATQDHCATSAALWAMLTHPAKDAIRPADLGAVLRGFQRLPMPLQAIVGPRLAERFVALNDPESADAVLNRLAPVSADVSSTEGEQAAAAIAGHQSGPAAEISALTDIARENIRMTPEALVDLLTLARSEGTPVAEDMIDLSAAFRFEYRMAPILPDLVRAEAQLLSDLGRHDEALALLEEERPHLDPELLVDLTSEAVKAITDKGDDPTFLSMALAKLPDQITPEVQNAVAARLIEMRFPERAVSLLLGPSSGSAAAERRYLRAAAAIQMDKPDEALSYIGGFTDERAARLRTLALNSIEDFGGAYAETAHGTGAMAEPEVAWRAGAWSDVARADDPVLEFAGTAMLGSERASVDPDPATISGGQSVLESAQRSRDMIGALLDRYQAPDS